MDVDAMNTAGDTVAREGERIVPGTELWDASYPDHIQRYRFALDYVAEGAAVLDAGCGVGYGAAEVADRCRARVVAVDISQDALALARLHFDRPTITWCRDDCEKLETAAAFAPFDVIINFENIEHLTRPGRFVARAAALLGRDGMLLTSTPNRLLLNLLRGVPANAPPSNHYHVNEFSEGEFRALLGQYFEHVVIWYQSPAGASKLRLRLHSVAARLRIMPLLRSARRLMRRSNSRSSNEAGRRGKLLSWTIDERDTGTAWTLIAVCRSPRQPAVQP
jgi:SAM-dependent methyltransferase